MNTDYIKLALKYTAKNRLRTSLTLLGILISIATIFILISVSLGLEAAVEEQFRALGSDKFFIQPRGQIASMDSQIERWRSRKCWSSLTHRRRHSRNSSSFRSKGSFVLGIIKCPNRIQRRNKIHKCCGV